MPGRPENQRNSGDLSRGSALLGPLSTHLADKSVASFFVFGSDLVSPLFSGPHLAAPGLILNWDPRMHRGQKFLLVAKVLI